MSVPGRIVATQALIGLVCVIGFALYEGSLRGAASLSALGALLATGVPSLYYAWVVQHSLSATRLLLHGVLRMVLTLMLMALGIVLFKVEPVGFFVTFALIQLAYLVPIQPGDR